MTISSKIRDLVRQRAHFACEYCGVTETDTGGELTIDHYQPQAKGGTDEANNLVYCCVRCNQYKVDYWPSQQDEPQLWNPRVEPADMHFLRLEDGVLYPLTNRGSFTLQRLRLNRPQLVAYRRRRRLHAEERWLLTQYDRLTEALERLQAQHATLLEEHRQLLEEQRRLLQRLIEES